jgi:hypothetical protein
MGVVRPAVLGVVSTPVVAVPVVAAVSVPVVAVAVPVVVGAGDDPVVAVSVADVSVCGLEASAGTCVPSPAPAANTQTMPATRKLRFRCRLPARLPSV